MTAKPASGRITPAPAGPSRGRLAPSGGVTPTPFLRLEFGGDDRIGPGKIALLESVEREHSISAAARAMGMSYRRAWLLIDTMNRMFREPVVVARPGRVAGRSAEVTAWGAKLVACYRTAERRTERACAPLVADLVAGLRPGYRPAPKPPKR